MNGLKRLARLHARPIRVFQCTHIKSEREEVKTAHVGPLLCMGGPTDVEETGGAAVTTLAMLRKHRA